MAPSLEYSVVGAGALVPTTKPQSRLVARYGGRSGTSSLGTKLGAILDPILPNARKLSTLGGLPGRRGTSSLGLKLGAIIDPIRPNARTLSTLGGVSSRARGARVGTLGVWGSLGSLSDDVFNKDTLCSGIPAGNAYRTPPNQCADDAGNYYTFDSAGSVVATGNKRESSLLSGPVPLYAAGALALYFLLK